MDLTEEQWRLVQPLLPPQPEPGRPGRPALDQRLILDGVLWKLRSRNPWRTVPARYGSHQVCYLHYDRWQTSGLMKKIMQVLAHDLKTRGEFDFEQALREQIVRIERLGSRLAVYFSFPFSETWQASTSMLIYQRLIESMEAAQRQQTG